MKKYIVEGMALKMLEQGLDFLPVEDSLSLKENGIDVKTRFHYVVNIEELDSDEFESNIDAVESYRKIYGSEPEIGNHYDHFSEFTYAVCPAPTYIDLIKLEFYD